MELNSIIKLSHLSKEPVGSKPTPRGQQRAALLREYILRSGISMKTLSGKIGVRKDALSHFLAGRRVKAGRSNCRMIEQYFISIGVMKPRERMTIIRNGQISQWLLNRNLLDLQLASEFQASTRCKDNN